MSSRKRLQKAKAEQLAKEHWDWLESTLKTHQDKYDELIAKIINTYEAQNMIMMAKLFQDAMVHGYKHGYSKGVSDYFSATANKIVSKKKVIKEFIGDKK